MRLSLALHPSSQCQAITGIEVEATRLDGESLALAYVVSGAIVGVRMPTATMPARTDDLWRGTCFEAFIQPAQAAHYRELNFSPSGQWAAYRFDSYRAGMTAALEINAPRIEIEPSNTRYVLRAWTKASGLASPWRLGLSAIIEEGDGNLSYWALAHPSSRPDFHHAAGFICNLSAPEQK